MSLEILFLCFLRLFAAISIFSFQFPDKSGFTLRCNPASGISAALRPAKLVRVMTSI
jgi:hypothetical protein